MRRITSMLLILFWSDHVAADEIQWTASMQYEDETKEYPLSSQQHKFYLPKSKWTCYASKEAQDVSKVRGEDLSRLTRNLKCVNLRDGDHVTIGVRCFKLKDQLNANSMEIVDDKKQKFTLRLSCTSI